MDELWLTPSLTPHSTNSSALSLPNAARILLHQFGPNFLCVDLMDAWAVYFIPNWMKRSFNEFGTLFTRKLTNDPGWNFGLKSSRLCACCHSVSFLNGSVDPRITEGRIIFNGYGYMPIWCDMVFNGYGYGFDPTRICPVGYGSQCPEPRITEKWTQIVHFWTKWAKLYCAKQFLIYINQMPLEIRTASRFAPIGSPTMWLHRPFWNCTRTFKLT